MTKSLSAQALEELLGVSPDMLTVVDESGVIKYKNPTIEEYLGYTPEVLIGDTVFDYIHPDDRQHVADTFYETVEATEGYTTSGVELRFRHADGSWVWLEAQMSNKKATEIAGYVVATHEISERKRHEGTLERLHEATRDLMAATTTDEVATIASETATEVLGLPMNSIHLYSPEQDALVPVAWSDRTEEVLGGPPPSIPAGESLAGRAYAMNTLEIYADVREADNVLNPETPLRSELHLPLGDHGVLMAGSTTVGDFDTSDEHLAQVFAANLEAALDRVEREQALTERNERLDEFAAIVSHDLRNPLNIIGGHLQLLQEEHDSDHLETMAEAHGRMETLIEDLLSLARQGDDVDDLNPVQLGALVEACWGNVETADARLRVETDQTVLADENRLKELVENLVRNAIEHGGEDVTITVGDLSGDEGFYIEDDGRGIQEADREEVFTSGFSTNAEGTGFGLVIVKRIVDAHGWTVTVTEGSQGGARFEFRVPSDAR
ncbi:ATP-binding protein [Halorubellus sp. PRR65]|uniref:PAS domain-containing sensor histidine kinase n=1 Tax=Halorubellus sp. PRR65 TaxID=3098148 RepID=UPI002B256615|nr:ATP-binding protein [Halorubellus sp. PRR65]